MVPNTTFNNIVAVSFIGGGNRSTQSVKNTCLMLLHKNGYFDLASDT